MNCGLQPLHTVLALTRWPMGVLTPVIELATRAVCDPRQDLPLRRAVALELIGDDDPRHGLQPLEELAEKRLRRVLIASALHQNIEDSVVLIDGPPQGMPLTMYRQEDLVQVPWVARLRTSPS